MVANNFQPFCSIKMTNKLTRKKQTRCHKHVITVLLQSWPSLDKSSPRQMQHFVERLFKRDRKIKTNLNNTTLSVFTSSIITIRNVFSDSIVQVCDTPGLPSRSAVIKPRGEFPEKRGKKRRLAVRSCNWRSKDGAGNLGGG